MDDADDEQKLLLEANMTAFRYNPAFGFPPPDGITNMIPVTEQSTFPVRRGDGRQHVESGMRGSGGSAHAALAPAANYTYRGLEQWGYAEGATNSPNGSASCVTGSHNIKSGYQYYWLRQLDETIAADNQLLYGRSAA